MLADLLFRLRSLFRRRRVEAELDDELRFHFDHEVEKQIQSGVSPGEARRRARLVFGGIDQLKEECRQARGVGIVESTLQDLRFAARTLWKTPVFSLGAILTLAVGIGGITAIFTVVNGVLLRPLPYPEADRLVMIWDRNDTVDRGFMSRADLPDLRLRADIFESVAGHRPFTFQWKPEGSVQSERIPAVMIGPEMFSVLKVQPALGRAFVPEEFEQSSRAVILSHTFWVRQFQADPKVIGRSIHLADQTIEIVGVMPADFEFYALNLLPKSATEAAAEPQLIFPLTANPIIEKMGRRARDLHVIARLKPGISLQSAQTDLAGLVVQLRQADANMKNRNFVAAPFRQDIVESARSIILLLFGAVGIVLLIAAANVANLLVIRSVNREREIVVRLAIGSTPMRLFRMIMTESLLLAFLGGVAGLGVAYAAVRALIPHLPSGFPRVGDIAVDPRICVFATIVTALSGLAIGLLPAIVASNVDLERRLRQTAQAVTDSSRSMRLRRLLLGGEVALSVLLLIGAGLVGKSFWRLMTQETGMNRAGILNIAISSDSARRNREEGLAIYRDIVERVRSTNGVNSVAYGTLQGASLGILTVEDGRQERNADFRYGIVSPDYFKTLSIPFVHGRTLSESGGEVVINERMASILWPGVDAVGQRFFFGKVEKPENPWLTVAGVVRDFKVAPSVDSVGPRFFGACGADVGGGLLLPCSSMSLAVRTNPDSPGVIPAIRSAVAEADRKATITSIQTSDEMLDRSVQAPRFRAALFSLFGSVALLLSMIGMYAVGSYSAARKTQEIGLRVALGATPSQIVDIVLRQMLLPVIGGTAAGLVVALGASRFVSAYLFEVTPVDPFIFTTVPIVVAVTAIVAMVLPVRRALSVDPVRALRYE